ncbi:MAG: MFS transporter [Nannocystaceae bacterium]|nr:MFS transporter [Nannocystaceae bacterium]
MERENTPAKTWLERVLSLAAEVRPGEAVTALILSLNVFAVLSAYYMIKPAREALILAMDSGAELKSYASAAIAVLLLLAVPLYGRVANRMQPNRLVISVTLFFVSNLVAFYFAGQNAVLRPLLGIPFYLWVGMFNMMVVAQFWAFANTVYTVEQGKRLFAVVGIGASLGAAVGSKVASALAERLGESSLMLVAAAVLSVSAVLTQWIHLRERDRSSAPRKPSSPAKAGGYAMVFSDRYLLLLAALTLILNFVNSNGEYVLSVMISDWAEQSKAAGTLGGLSKGAFIAKQYADFFFYVNIMGVVLQTFVVSRIVRWGGMRLALLVLPVIVLGSWSLIALFPALLMVRVGKTVENATDYSINNTVCHMLWLPTSREAKFKAKQAVDAFFVRMGDVASAGLVFAATTLTSLSVSTFALINVALAGGWILVAAAIMRQQKRLLAGAVADSRKYYRPTTSRMHKP